MDRKEDIMEIQDDQHMEENNNQDEEMQDVNTRSENYVSLPDFDEILLLGHHDDLGLETTFSKEQLDHWVSDLLLGVESKADEAQEALEKESLAKVGSEVREDSALTLRCVEEQLDGARVELPKLYKMTESQVPNGCYTEACKKRAHWVGTQATKETVESLANAETFLHTHRPVQKRHGKLLEEGASVFLDKMSADDGFKECLAGPSEVDWSSLNSISKRKKDEAVSFGSKNCASVYSASTPQQAAAMGLKFPGVNEEKSSSEVHSYDARHCLQPWKVAEIGEIGADLTGTFFADAIANERELALTEEQRENNMMVIRDTEENPTIPNLEEDKLNFPEKATGVDKSSYDIADVNVAISSKKKIQRIIDDADLGKDTKREISSEKERQERFKSFPFSARYRTYSSLSTGKNVLQGAEFLGDAHSGYIVNVFREIGEEVVRIPPSISAQLKDHQVTGIRFMWENIVQSINGLKSGDKGLGCILAHTMGLGKTFQVIAFLYTAMRCVDLGLKTALIVTPVNVLHNWQNEFAKWTPSEVKPLGIFMLEDVSREMRLDMLKEWRSKGGVLLLGYATFRNLSLGKGVKDINAAREIYNAMTDGPDILVCDEAHTIKNTGADTTKALKQVKCQRRIALTGSPLENNLMEYYCMVDIVREGLLGSSTEFRNRFQNPIEKGKHMNPTAEDVKSMNRRSHILYEELKGFVQRMDMNVLKHDLPPKTVFVISVKLSPLQRELYKRFLEIYGISDGRTDEKMRKNLFDAYQVLAQILNHPGIPKLRREGSRDGGRARIVHILDDSSSDEDCNMDVGEKQGTMSGLQNEVDGNLQEDWWVDLLDNTKFYKAPEYSGKMILVVDLLAMCADVDDKALVFSQSVPTLDLIELYLSRLPRNSKQGGFWEKGIDWYRIDGKTEISERQKVVDMFNEPENKMVKCALISTRAGSPGINLYAANRVIIVDGSWDPTYELQAIDRAWSYGQKKPVFAYRLMASGTVEEKIYKRQVTKKGLAARVEDRQQEDKNISKEEMLHLFEFDEAADSSLKASLKQKVGCWPDKLMENLLERHNLNWISSLHEHETLLKENHEEEKVTKEEVQHVPVVVQEPAPSPQRKPPRPPKSFNRSRFVRRTCTKTAHQRTLISQGRKVGSRTICGECGQVITWENLTPPATKIDYF